MLRAKKIMSGYLCICFIIAHAESVLLSTPYQGGWIQNDYRLLDPDLIWEVPEWNGVGEGQTRLLYQDYERVYGFPYEPRNQGDAPSCVGQAAAAAVDFLAAIEICAGEPERRPPAHSAACIIYGLSRVEIGGINSEMPGSYNIWACQALKEYGSVAQLNYFLLGHDLRHDRPELSAYFGRMGVPTSLELIAKMHSVRDYVSIDSYEECRDALYSGYPVIVGSEQGFGEGKLTRDSDGFLVPPRWRYASWNHSMCIIGVCDSGRKGCLIINSWGNDWVDGPKRFGDEPEGSFWVDWWVIDSMVKQGDSFALRGFEGYPNYLLRK